jgi:flagellum-specific peptidoglycan hydrolase FlgJ
MDSKTFQLMYYAVSLAFPSVHVSSAVPLAQAKIESGNFTSHAFLENNNFCGMTVPSVRSTTAVNADKPGAAAIYANPLDCMRDYFKFLDELGLHDDAALLARINAGKYATDKAYPGKVAQMVKQLAASGELLSAEMVYGAGAVATAAVGVAVAAIAKNVGK